MDPHLKRVVVVIVLSTIMSSLDTTVINVALDTLSRDLHTGVNNIQWVVSAYLLALAAVIPLCGWAVRRYGAYRVFLVSLTLFTLGSALCAIATSAPQLIAFRAVQGLGGGLLLPTGMTILVQTAGKEYLPQVMTAIGVTGVLAPAIGPTMGALLLQTVGWHAIFVINVPIGIVTAYMAVRLLPRSGPDKAGAGKLDWPGLLLAGTGMVGITFGLSESATAGSFASTSVIVPVLIGFVLLASFVLRARRIDHPLLDIRLYRIRAYSLATVLMFGVSGALFASLILLPLYYQLARGQSVIHTGLLLIPQAFAGAIGMKVSAPVSRRVGAGLTSAIGVVLLILATVPFLFVTATTPYLLIIAAQLVRGLGIGLSSRPSMTAAYAVLSHDQINDASPQINVIQRVGGSLGTALIAVVLDEKLTHIGPHAAASAVARCFAETYAWVTAMCLVALVPAVLLWRFERRSGVDWRRTEVRDQPIEEALA